MEAGAPLDWVQSEHGRFLTEVASRSVAERGAVAVAPEPDLGDARASVTVGGDGAAKEVDGGRVADAGAVRAEASLHTLLRAPAICTKMLLVPRVVSHWLFCEFWLGPQGGWDNATNVRNCRTLTTNCRTEVRRCTYVRVQHQFSPVASGRGLGVSRERKTAPGSG